MAIDEKCTKAKANDHKRVEAKKLNFIENVFHDENTHAFGVCFGQQARPDKILKKMIKSIFYNGSGARQI